MPFSNRYKIWTLSSLKCIHKTRPKINQAVGFEIHLIETYSS
jgi:hypothetical protein